MIEVTITVDTQADYQVVINKNVRLGRVFNLGEIAQMVFELEKMKRELILKSYEIKPIYNVLGKTDEQKQDENKLP